MTASSWQDKLDRAAQKAEALREKRGERRSASAYWLGDRVFDEFDRFAHPSAEVRESPEYLMKLANIRKGIANFVRIITGENIPVIFSSGQQSYTNKKVVVISATNDPAKFDMNVGLALHEAAHLILSRVTAHPDSVPLFDFLNDLMDHPSLYIDGALYDVAARVEVMPFEVVGHLRWVVNVLEDRRIDQWMYTNAIGYRPYYEAMYEALWHSDEITMGLKSALTRRPLVKYFFFHLTNMTNAAARPDALPGLREIWKLINLPEISRLGGQDARWATYRDHLETVGGDSMYVRSEMPEMLQVALEILRIIYTNSKREDEVPSIANLAQSESGQGNQGDSSASGTGTTTSEGDHDEGELPNMDLSTPSVGPDEGDTDATPQASKGRGSGRDEDEGEPSRRGRKGNDTRRNGHDNNGRSGRQSDDGENHGATAEDLKRLDKALDEALEKQEEMLRGNVEKESVGPEMRKTLAALEGAGAQMAYVGKGYVPDAKVPCIVYHNLSFSLLETTGFPFSNTGANTVYENPTSAQAVAEGTRMGDVLAHRIRVLADEAPLKFNRQERGKLDKRMIAGLGYDASNVFSHTEIVRHAPVLVHLSLDGSSSMNHRRRWHNALKLATALARCASKTRNMDIVVSVRAGANSGNAAIAKLFDSRTDAFSKVTQLWPYLCVSGYTPEGLCFEATAEAFLSGDQNTRKFFVNISDGEPYFTWSDGVQTHSYSGPEAAQHTARQMRRLQENGVQVLSYFVGDSGAHLFKLMYGREAQFINPESVGDIARTLNQMFLRA